MSNSVFWEIRKNMTICLLAQRVLMVKGSIPLEGSIPLSSQYNDGGQWAPYESIQNSLYMKLEDHNSFHLNHLNHASYQITLHVHVLSNLLASSLFSSTLAFLTKNIKRIIKL